MNLTSVSFHVAAFLLIMVMSARVSRHQFPTKAFVWPIAFSIAIVLGYGIVQQGEVSAMFGTALFCAAGFLVVICGRLVYLWCDHLFAEVERNNAERQVLAREEEQRVAILAEELQQELKAIIDSEPDLNSEPDG